MGDRRPFLIDLFEESATRNPQNHALFVEENDGVKTFRKFTYNEVNDLANKIHAEVLPQLTDGGSVGTPLVAIMMDRDIGFIASMLSILKSEAAYVPVDPAFPPDRQSHIFAHSKCELLIVDQECYASAVRLGVQMPPYIVVDSRTAAIISLSPNTKKSTNKRILRSNERKNKDHSLAYVLYTSGSTGKPKGVMVKNIGVGNIINWFADALCVDSNSRVMGLTTFCFDISVLEMYVPLTKGAVLVLAKSATQKDPFRLLDLIQESRVSVFQATPTTYEMLFATGWTGDRSIDFLVGGEAFRPSILPLAQNCHSLRNVYGPTETTIWSSSYTVEPGFEAKARSLAGGSTIAVPIGAPISETEFYLVSEEKPYRVMPEGAEGELWIGGIGVASGYLHAPDLTEKVFLENPFGSGMVYRTGDVVKKCPEFGRSNYIFSRRLDDQVKIDGFRIELAEIETVFAKHVLLDKAVAVVRLGKLVLYVLSKSCAAAKGSPNPESFAKLTEKQIEDIKTEAGRSLTYYMMPKFIVEVTVFPQTANGKLDRKALPDPPGLEGPSGVLTPGPQGSAGGAGTGKGASRTKNTKISMTTHILDIVDSVKGFRPSPMASFATIGVDSLGAVMFVRRLSDSLGGFRIAPTAVFAAGNTIHSFAVDLDAKIRSSNPALLLKLNIVPDAEAEVEQTNEQTNGVGLYSPSPTESAFDNLMASNKIFLEGLRGLFAFMVLWDHYPWVHTNMNIKVDTYLFILMTGFTTALQLRPQPSYEKKVSMSGVELVVLKQRSDFNWSTFTITRVIGIIPLMWLALIFHAPWWYLQDNSTDFPYPADESAALRAEQLQHVPGLGQSRDGAVCTFLYVIGMEQWYQPQCHFYGANQTLYASIILNQLLFYAIFRYYAQKMQNYIMSWRSDTFVLPLSQQSAYYKENAQQFQLLMKAIGTQDILDANEETNDRSDRDRNREGDRGQNQPPRNVVVGNVMIVDVERGAQEESSKKMIEQGVIADSQSVYDSIPKWIGVSRARRLGALMTLMCYGRPTTEALKFSLLFGLLMAVPWIFFILILYGGGALKGDSFSAMQNFLSFVPYFLIGLMFANVLEGIHYACSQPIRTTSQPSTERPAAEVYIELSNVSEVRRDLSPESKRVQVTDSSESITKENQGMEEAWCQCVDFSYEYSVASGDCCCFPFQMVSCNFSNTYITEMFKLCGRFLPDMIVVLCVVFTQDISPFKDQPSETILRYIILPFLMLCFTGISMLQTGSNKLNLSRLILESWPMNLLGYCSYTLFLFHKVTFDFWVSYIVLSIRGDPKAYAVHPSWHKYNLEWWGIIIMGTLLVGFCWFCQYFFQDRFVVWCYGKLQAYFSKK